jgi:N-acetylneuraminate lyase
VKPFRLTGLIAAPFTPFNADYSLNLEAVPAIARHLIRQKVTGAFVAGTTGEWSSLTQGERKALTVAWRKAAGSKLKVIVHVGHNCLADSQELAAHAEANHADAIGAIMPAFFRPPTLDDCVDYCRQIAAAAPRTPFYYYHFPEITGVNFNMVDFLPAAKKAIKSFRGIKFTYYNLMDYGSALAAAGDRYDVLFGRDEILLGGLAAGAQGAVGSTYNYCAKLHYKLIRLVAAGKADEARELEVSIQKIMALLGKYDGGIVSGKAIMAMVGVDCGPCRPPFGKFPAKKRDALRAELAKLGFFSAVKV